MKYIASIITSNDPYKSIAGSIEIGYDCFIVSSSNFSYIIPYDNCKITKGGFDGVDIIIEGNSNDNVQLYITVQDHKILDDILLKGNKSINPIVQKLKTDVVKTTIWKKVALYSFIFFVLITLLAFYIGIEYLVNLALENIPISLDNELGQKIVQNLYTDDKKIKSGIVVDYTNKIFDKLLIAEPATKHYNFNLHIVKDKQINAFAAPGGHIVVLTGLLENIESAEELAGILAHEIQHVLFRHSTKALLQRAGLYITFSILFGNNADFISVAANLGSRLATLSYSRKQEREADTNAVKLLMNANINPTKFIDFFTRLKRNSSKLEGYLTILSTHPGLSEREAYLKELFEKTNAYNANYYKFNFEWTEVKNCLKKIK